MDEQEPPHWESAQTIHRLGELLNLPPESVAGQDWEHVCADADRLDEFFDLYENAGRNDNEKHALMKLIVSSFDDCLSDPGINPEQREIFQTRIERLLRRDFLLHQHSVRYWCSVDTADIDDALHATPLMRRIWSDSFKPEHQKWLKEYE